MRDRDQHMRILIERLSREGKTEREIERAVKQMLKEDRRARALRPGGPDRRGPRLPRG